MVKFTILIVTYNRPVLVEKTLVSVLQQSYTNFEILLYDNGSIPSVEVLLEKYRDPRIIFHREERNLHGCDLGEYALNNMKGTHFIVLGDDDILLPKALEIVSQLFNNEKIHMLSTGYVKYDHDKCCALTTESELDIFTGRLFEYRGFDLGLKYCECWGIGEKSTCELPRLSHPSSTYISKDLIEKTRKTQRVLFVKPFGDVGYVGACFNTKTVYYLDLPLSVIGTTAIRDLNKSKKGYRMELQRDVQYLKYTGIKAPSFVNMATEAHLRCIYSNNIDQKVKINLRPIFFINHIRQIASDRPWNEKTLLDLAECIYPLATSILNYFSLALFKDSLLYLSKFVFRKLRLAKVNKDTLSTSSNKYKDILYFAKKVEKEICLKKSEGSYE